MLHKEYHTAEDGRTIKFLVGFNKESVNWATGEPKKVGYEVTAKPVKITQGEGYSMEEFGAFTGFNDNLLPIDRPSPKRLKAAIAALAEKLPTYLNYFNNQATKA